MPFPTFKTQAEIPDAFRGEYEERDGQWHPKVPDVAKLEETLGVVRKEKREAEKVAREAAEKAADLQRQLDVKTATGQDGEKKVAEMLTKWEADKQAAVGAVQAQLDAANGKLRTLTLDDKVKAAALKAGVNPAKVDAVLKLTKETFDLADDRIVVKNDKGEVTTGTVEDFFAKTYKAQMPELYTGTKAAGGGANGGSGSAGTPTGAPDATKDPQAALRWANENEKAA